MDNPPAQLVYPPSSPAACSTLGPGELYPGIHFNWLQDGQVAYFSLRGTRTTRASVDAWAEAIKTVLIDWPPGQDFFVIQDCSRSGAGPTPYTTGRLREVHHYYTGKNIYIAVVISKTPIGYLIHAAVNFYRPNDARIAVVYSTDEALRWIQDIKAVSISASVINK